MVDPFLFLPSLPDALQTPDHRWQRCEYLLEDGRPPTPHDQVARAHPALAEAR